MIHHSNPKCDVCGERHSAGHIGECNEVLVKQVQDLKAQLEDSASKPPPVVPPLDELVAFIQGYQSLDRSREISYRNNGEHVPANEWQARWEQKEQWLKALREVRA